MLESLPPELLEQILRQLRPNELLPLRQVSRYLKACVDGYVLQLMKSGAFTNTAGTNLRHWSDQVTVAEVLKAWINGDLLAAPAGGLTPEQILDCFDRIFAPDSDRSDLLRDLLKLSKRGDGPGLDESLLIYVRELLDRGRLTDRQGQALPRTTPLDEARQMWKDGNATWQPPH